MSNGRPTLKPRSPLMIEHWLIQKMTAIMRVLSVSQTGHL